jgi:phosphoribosyl 1,2-cyclic phosphodiesterase
MSLHIASINSGSNGNCYYVGNANEAVLIDAGISCREIEKRMARLNLSLQKVKAIFISHEHTDHTRGISVLSRKYKLPVYISSATHLNSGLFLDKELLFGIEHLKSITIGELTVKPFKKLHDAADPYSFNISDNQLTIGVYTDIGSVCHQVINHFKDCDAVFLEANYDEYMLDNGHYPFHLKQRIKSDTGHLSNTQALNLFTTHKSPSLSHLILSHLSKENNNPGLVERLFKEVAGQTKIVVASRYNESELFFITGDMTTKETEDDSKSRSQKTYFKKVDKNKKDPLQISLF